MGFLVCEDRHCEVFGDGTVGVLGSVDERPIRLDSVLFGVEDTSDNREYVGRILGRL